MLRKTYLIFFIFILLFPAFYLNAQEKRPQQAMPPAVVVVSEVGAAFISPENEFIGTVYYHEISDVASEVNGKIEEVNFEEGQRVKKGHVLVRMSSDLLEKTRQATQASYEQALSDLERERKNLERAEGLFKDQLLSEQSYDERKFAVNGLGKKAASLKAELERIEIELGKKAVTSPFDGIVVKKHSEKGEWLSPGSVVATIAGDDHLDITAEVPGRIIKHINAGMEVKVKAGGKEMIGKVSAIVPRGDVSTRTVPVKVKIRNTASLLEGMEARVSLPSGEKERAMTVPRDAVITMFGNTVVFVVTDSKAKMIPVKIVGYQGMNAGVHGEDLGEGMKVVTKGNERLRDGQPVSVQK